MDIVAATTDDISELIRVQAECDLSPWTRPGYEAEFDRTDSVILVARTPDGTVTGFIVGRAPRPPSPGDAEIYNIGVRQAFRRHGTGSGLLHRFIQTCRERVVRAVWLEVRAGNAAAIKFYGSHGFTIAASRPRFYSGPVEDARIMVLELALRSGRHE